MMPVARRLRQHLRPFGIPAFQDIDRLCFGRVLRDVLREGVLALLLPADDGAHFLGNADFEEVALFRLVGVYVRQHACDPAHVSPSVSPPAGERGAETLEMAGCLGFSTYPWPGLTRPSGDPRVTPGDDGWVENGCVTGIGKHR